MKARIISICTVIVLSVTFTHSVNAQNGSRDFKTALEECFWGLILTSEDQRGLALGLNVVSGALGSYAYTSATASADTFCSEKTASTASFINDSYPKLVEDTARGEGEYLAAVLELAGCDSTQQGVVIPLLRADMAQAIGAADYAGQSYADKVFGMYRSINEHAQQACNIG
jgi:hypothetical protein